VAIIDELPRRAAAALAIAIGLDDARSKRGTVKAEQEPTQKASIPKPNVLRMI